MSEATGELFYGAELWRLKGEVLARNGSLAEAEHCLREGIDMARRQGARLFELRNAASLCRVLESPRKQAALCDMLAPVHDWFGEAVDAPDVKDARALLAGRTGT
jgi:hypothetical protein